MKVWERIIEARVKDNVEISKQQYGFMPGKGTTVAMFALRITVGNHRCHVDEKVQERSKGPRETYNRVPWEELWYCMRRP